VGTSNAYAQGTDMQILFSFEDHGDDNTDLLSTVGE
jgi:hypothetical protein